MELTPPPPNKISFPSLNEILLIDLRWPDGTPESATKSMKSIVKSNICSKNCSGTPDRNEPLPHR